jgi:hypothetical protein
MVGRTQIVVDLDADLRDAFVEAARAEERPVSDIVEELIAGYVHSSEMTPEYQAFLERKVAKARASIRAGRGASSAEVEARFAKRRTAIDGA